MILHFLKIKDIKNYKDMLKVEQGWRVGITIQFWIVGSAHHHDEPCL